jgi:uncharacterized membrane protein YfcA
MNTIELSLIIAAGLLLAGFLGALTGLGGGVVIVPMLTLAFGIDIRYAIGASLISVIATSSGAAAAYVKEGYSNIRVGMFLEIATTAGALTGTAIALHLPLRVIAVIFGVVLMYSAYLSWRQEDHAPAIQQPDRFAKLLRLHGAYPAANGLQHYQVQGVPLGFGLMYLAGMLSGMLGIGSGAVKVLAMDKAMKLPFKVSTTTSNFMIGVTAAASAGIYLNRGYIDPALAMPVMLGVLAGSLAGARVLAGAPVRTLRLIFSIVIALLGVEMIFNGLKGRI